MTEITLIVAMNQDNVIGTNNQLPWHIPEDLAHFKQVTLGKPVIMGRKTFESIGRVLPGRKNIVISRNCYSHEGVICYSSLEEAIADNQDVPELCVIGGGEIFALAIPVATTLHITEVDCMVDNPCARFPVIDNDVWELKAARELVSVSGIKCIIKEYQRRNNEAK